MNIGTAKPAPELLSILPHHLVDFLDPSEQYTAGDFVRRADALC
ncbi:MAG: tRNA (adenosine(37)-N6)-dimethylallyltransferase MiaA, partial [Spirochaetaceae bacterium]|nr:tRNA (adenosine(37)-N6)-dimethylallyltransferase MiaA [Spirochaetaceae bacterium]